MSDVNAPANRPIFDPPPIRGNRKMFQSASFGGASESWSHAETVNPATSEYGAPCYFPFDVVLHTLYLAVVNVSNVSLTVNTLVGGGLAATSVLPSGSNLATFTPDLTVVAGQSLYPVLLAAPTGTGYGLGITYWYRPA